MQKPLQLLTLAFIILACNKDPDIIDINIPDPPRTLAQQLPGDYDLDAVEYISTISVDLGGIDLPVTSSGTDKNPNGGLIVESNNLNFDGQFTLQLSTIPGLPAFPIPVSIGNSGTFSIRGGNLILETSDGPLTLDVISHGPYHVTVQSNTSVATPIPLPGLSSIPVTYTLHYIKNY